MWDAQTAAYKAHPCHEVGSSKGRGHRSLSVLYDKYQHLFSLVHHHHPCGETSWPGQGLSTSRYTSQCPFIYCTLNCPWMNHPSLKSRLSSQVSQAPEKGQLLVNTTTRCHHVCASPWDRGIWGLLLCWASQGPLSRIEVLLSGLSWVEVLLFGLPLHSAMSQNTENNQGCCISGHAKQPLLNYSARTESVGTSWERCQGCSYGEGEARHPVTACWVCSGSVLLLQCCKDLSFTLCLTNCRQHKNEERAENNHRK